MNKCLLLSLVLSFGLNAVRAAEANATGSSRGPIVLAKEVVTVLPADQSSLIASFLQSLLVGFENDCSLSFASELGDLIVVTWDAPLVCTNFDKRKVKPEYVNCLISFCDTVLAKPKVLAKYREKRGPAAILQGQSPYTPTIDLIDVWEAWSGLLLVKKPSNSERVD